MAVKRKQRRDEKGRFLPMSNLPQRYIGRIGKPSKDDDEYEYHEVTEIPRKPAVSSPLTKVAIAAAVVTTLVVVYKGVQMLDIKENIQVKMTGLRNAHMVGSTAFGFTLDVKLINTTKSSMTMSYPVVTLVVKRAATVNKPAKEVQITQSSSNGKSVTIKANGDTSLSFDFEMGFLSLLSVVTMINPLTLFDRILTEITTPTGKNGKPNFKQALSGTGLSFWANTQIYAGGILKKELVERIF